MSEKKPEQNSQVLKNALLELRRMRHRLSIEEQEKNEPIAIVGTACRYANGVDNTDKFYSLLKEGTDTVKEIPADRWDVDKYYSTDLNSKDTMYTREGSFIDQVDQFDAEFFNISGREASALDPQQRLLLELGWEAMENAAIVNTAIPDKRAGVFIAGMNTEYAQLSSEAGDFDVHTGAGTMVAVAAGRLAYVLGLHGPTMIVDTACSSSLVAVHIACQSLRRKECDVALAGGANLMLAPQAMIVECVTKMLSPQGRCKTFDAEANGFGRGEGGGMVALKRLSDAIAGGDNIVAVIRGSAVNHDGQSSGLSVPNGLAQEAVIREALKNSKLDTTDIGYIEAHGTGTHLGDPIEVGALQSVFGKGRDADKPLLIGSVKTNLGHLEWSAGITGLLKTAVSLQHNKIFPHINYSKPNPLLDIESLNIRIPTQCEQWPSDSSFKAGVSSFGFSGTNSHVVLEQAPVIEKQQRVCRGAEVFVVSAKSAEALKAQVKQYRIFIERNIANKLSIEDLCFTAATGRNHFSHRLSIECVDINELKNKLVLLESGCNVDGAFESVVKDNEQVKLAYLCTGAGSQYIGMARELYQSEPIFKSIMDRCSEYLHVDLLITFDETNDNEFDKNSSLLPALYAIETALAALWVSWGIKPAVVLGHNVGEYAAAQIAGIFSLEDGLKLISARGELIKDSSLPLSDSIISSFMAVAKTIKYNKPSVSIVSSVTGQLADSKISTAEYWCTQLSAPVDVLNGVKTLGDLGVSHYLEIGEKDILISRLNEEYEINIDLCFSSLANNINDLQSMLSSLGAAYTQGCNINWKNVYAGRGYRKITLPTYPFQRKRYWLNHKKDKEQNNRNVKNTLNNSDVLRYINDGSVKSLVNHLSDQDSFNEKEKELLPKISKALINSHKKDEINKEQHDWLYNIEWLESEKLLASTEKVKPGHWIVLSNSTLGNKLKDSIVERGQQCIKVTLSDTYAKPLSDEASIRLSEFHDIDRIIEYSKNDCSSNLLGVINLFPSEEKFTKNITLDILESSQKTGVEFLLNLSKSLDKHKVKLQHGLWLITRGMYSIHHEPLNLAMASLSGFSQTIALEHKEFWGGCIDLMLDPQETLGESIDILNVVTNLSSDLRTAFRGKKQFVPRLKHQSENTSANLTLTPNSSYIITGGTGGLGISLAQWLADKDAHTIVLVSRSKPTKVVLDKIKLISMGGANIIHKQLDISNAQSVECLLDDINKNEMPLKGIIHAAGSLDDVLVRDLSWQRYQNIIAAKVKGSWNLHQATLKETLDFFVLFSSTASVFGSVAQANYSAGNSFLDSLAQYRQQQGLTCLSINWGPWADVGMAANLDDKNKQRISERGIYDINVSAGLHILERLIVAKQYDISQRAVLSIDWNVLSKGISDKRSQLFLSEIPEFNDSNNTSLNSELKNLEELVSIGSEQRKVTILSYLKTLVSATLKVEESILSDDSDLMDAGIDSLMIMEMIDSIKKDLNLMIYPREVYANPCLSNLACYINTEFSNTHNCCCDKINENEAVSYEEKTFSITDISDPREGLGKNFSPLKPMLFLLSTPRAGSTLLRAMLAGHPELFSPPELHLLTFSSMAKRDAQLKGSYLDEGFQRALMELKGIDAGTAKKLISELVDRDAPVTEAYELIQQLAGHRLVVDKSPTYALDPCVLDRAEIMFGESKYIHLIRHPLPSIRSFSKMRMDKLLAPDSNDPFALAEKVWSQGNENIDAFLRELPVERVHQVFYESLVTQPTIELEKICKFLKIDYSSEVMQPYATGRMTDGVHEKSLSIGDPNFNEYNRIESNKADAWKNNNSIMDLNPKTVALANRWDYDISVASSNKVVIDLNKTDINMKEVYIDVRGLKYCLCCWGDESAPLVFLIHGILDQGASWEQVAINLVNQGYRVVAPDLRGHGRSAHVGIGGSYNVLDYLADLDEITEKFSNDKFILVGHSMGSILASMYAGVHTEKLRALVLVETILPIAINEDHSVEQLKNQLKHLKEKQIHSSLKSVSDAAKMLRQITPSLSDEYSNRLAERMTKEYDGGYIWRWDPILNTRAVAISGNGMSKKGYLELLLNIKVPITLLFGDSSQYIRPNELIELKNVLHQSKQYTLKGGHQLHHDSPNKVAHYINQSCVENVHGNDSRQSHEEYECV